MTYPSIRVAAIQAASIFLDRDRTVQKACDLIHEAAAGGAKLVAFPENFIPGHCLWYHYHTIGGDVSKDLTTRLFLNSIEIPGPEVDALSSAAEQAGAVVVIGVSERRRGILGTLYNTQLVIDSDGSIAGKHQKLMPTKANAWCMAWVPRRRLESSIPQWDLSVPLFAGRIQTRSRYLRSRAKAVASTS